MTGHRQPWYLDRLRAELERVAAIEDRRERGPAPVSYTHLTLPTN